MSVKLLTEHHLKFLSLKGRLQRLVRVYTCQIVGNTMPWLLCFFSRTMSKNGKIENKMWHDRVLQRYAGFVDILFTNNKVIFNSLF